MKSYARWHWFDYVGLVAVILPAVIWLVAWAVTDVTRNLNISAIRIPDVVEGEPIYMDVTRTIDGRWHGAYRVAIRHVNGGALVCLTGDVPIPFAAQNNDGTERRLPEPLPLKWWADGGSCEDDLAQNTLPVGVYSVETCHAQRYLRFFYKWHCWPGGPIFEVRERGQ